MAVILGIDIGGSTTKIVGLQADKSIIGVQRVKAEGPLPSLYGALGSFMTNHHLELRDIDRVVLTGVGASHVEGQIYGIPTIKDIPDDMEIIYVETPRKDGPYGASGVGEMPLTAPHPAIINAIYNACGARIRHLPAYPEKVLAAMPK